MVHHTLEGVRVVVLTRFHPDQTSRNIRTVIRDTLRIVQHVQEYNARIDRTDARFQSFDMLITQTLHEDINDLLDRLDLPSHRSLPDSNA